MKKTLYFRSNIQIHSIKLKILIDNGRIREYEGFNLLSLMFTGIQPKFEIFKLNSHFQLLKLSKYDQKHIPTKANYQIVSPELMNYLGQDTFIKLNYYEKFKIQYSKKEDVFHKMNLTQKILTLILITIPSSLIIGYITKCDRTQQVNKPATGIQIDSTHKTK